MWTPFHEALFTSTSAVCVTGLVVQDTGSYWSAFGQTVIPLLIQIGGLGVITAAVTFLMLSGKNIPLKERSAMQDAISAPVVGGIVRLTRFILKGTFLVELVGALALLPASLPGLWTAGRVDGNISPPFPPLQRRVRISKWADALYPSLDGVHGRPAGQYRHHAADRRGRYRFSDMGRCLAPTGCDRSYRMQSKVSP